MGRKSSKIAAKKGAADKQRSLVYTKALHDVATSVKTGGGDPASNFLLKIALERCRKFNVPKDNIDRAIKKGLGGGGDDYADVTYEGYGPGGVGVFVESSTNNITRTVANVRSYFNKTGGSLGKDGCLEFIFDRQSVFTIPKGDINFDDFSLEMMDVEGEVEEEDETFEVYGPMNQFGTIQNKLQEMNIVPEEAGLQRIPTTHKAVTDQEMMEQLERLIDMLESDEDVVSVYHNLEAND